MLTIVSNRENYIFQNIEIKDWKILKNTVAFRLVFERKIIRHIEVKIIRFYMLYIFLILYFCWLFY